MVFSLAQILGGFIAPVLVIAVLSAIAWKFLSDARWVFGPIIAAGFSVTYIAVNIRVGWPPTANVSYLLFYVPIVLGILTLIDALAKPPLWLRVIGLALIWRISVRLILARLIPSSLSPPSAEIWIDLSTLISITWFLTLEHLAERAPGITVPLLLTLLSGATALFIALGWHIQSSGALAGELALLCVAEILVSLIIPRTVFSRGFAQMIALILQLLLVHAWFYTDDTLTDAQQIRAALLMALPLLALLGDLPKLRDIKNPLLRLTIRLAPVIIIMAIISAQTARDFAHGQQAAAQEDE